MTCLNPMFPMSLGNIEKIFLKNFLPLLPVGSSKLAEWDLTLGLIKVRLKSKTYIKWLKIAKISLSLYIYNKNSSWSSNFVVYV